MMKHTFEAKKVLSMKSCWWCN